MSAGSPRESASTMEEKTTTPAPVSLRPAPRAAGCCGLSCFSGGAAPVEDEGIDAPRRKRLSMWNGELDEKFEEKARLSPEELHAIPSDEVLADVGKVTLLDRNRNKITFKELVNDKTARRTIVIFIRHFFCGMCYGYVRNLSADLLPGKLEAFDTPTRLVIVGCGDPILIPQYVKETNCPFEIYCDKSRKLYQMLGFCVNGEANEEKPAYVQKYSPGLATNLLISGKMAAKTMKTSGGLINQNGGEMIWIDGKLKFIHRMRNTTDHIEVSELEQILVSQDIELSEEEQGLLHDMDNRSKASADTKRSKRSRISWARPMSFIREHSFFSDRKASVGGDSLNDPRRPSSQIFNFEALKSARPSSKYFNSKRKSMASIGAASERQPSMAGASARQASIATQGSVR